MLSSILTPVFQNTTADALNTLHMPKSQQSFVMVNVHHSSRVEEIKQELLNNNSMNVTKI